jgi:multiple sugar transport system permease protein
MSTADTTTTATTRARAAEETTGDARGPRENPLSVAGATLFMVIFAIYFLIPIWWLLVASSKTTADILGTNGLWFSSPFKLFANIYDAVSYNNWVFVRWLVNSLLYAGLGALFATLFATMAGYGLAKYVFPGREVYFNTVLGGVLVPATALALPLFLLFSKIHAVDTYWSVFLPSIVSPFGVYLARIYAAASVPDELLEASRLDGAGEFRTFFGLGTRLMAPALVTIFLFQFVAIWNNFFLPLIMLQNERLYPLTLGLYTWNSTVTRSPELRSFVIVGALLSIIPLIIAFLSLQRFWRSGLAAGGVK